MYKKNLFKAKQQETMKSKAWIIAAPFSGSFFELSLPTSDVSSFVRVNDGIVAIGTIKREFN